ncbi:MAG TPA: hypothetical protein VLL97_11210 [Acidobacteriota bacterium]|nr:hypothetical protein [Acidobacteriota bacterium]
MSAVGITRRELTAAGKAFEEVTIRYGDYGAAIAEGVATGYVRAFISRTGRILGAQVDGEVRER